MTNSIKQVKSTNDPLTDMLHLMIEQRREHLALVKEVNELSARVDKLSAGTESPTDEFDGFIIS